MGLWGTELFFFYYEVQKWTGLLVKGSVLELVIRDGEVKEEHTFEVMAKAV